MRHINLGNTLPKNPKIYYSRDVIVPYKGVDYKVSIINRDFVTLERWYNDRPLDRWSVLEFDENQIPGIETLEGTVIPIVNGFDDDDAINAFKKFIDSILTRIVNKKA